MSSSSMGSMVITGLLIFSILLSRGVRACVTGVCSCEVDKIVCKWNPSRPKLTEVPDFPIDQFGSHYSELTLSGNAITNIPANAFNGLNVAKIDLGQNPVTTISEAAFNGTEGVLKELIIGGSRTASFPWPAVTNIETLTALQIDQFHIPNITTPNFFQNLSQLKTLSLINVMLETVSDRVFASNSQITLIDFSKNQLTEVPSNAFRDIIQLKVIKLSTNLLTALRNNTFQYNTNLQKLILDGNSRLSELELDAFIGVETSLQELDLRSCAISSTTSMPLQALTNLRGLQKLNLAHNLLVSMPDNFTQGMSRLQELRLNSNFFSSLNSNTFGASQTLRDLYLNQNSIQGIGGGSFTGLTGLNKLDLSQQTDKINFSPNALQGLEASLCELDLSNTQFNNWDVIEPLISLKTLKLVNNNLMTIKSFVFNHIRLQHLWLGGNQLSYLTEEMVFGLRDSLIAIHLQNNQIQEISYCVFQNFTTTYSIDVTGNPLTCGCSLRWLKQWFDKLDDFYKPLYRWVCHDNQTFYDLTLADFECLPNYTKPICIDYYTQPTSKVPSTEPSNLSSNSSPQITQPKVTTPVPFVIHVSVTSTSSSSITIEWNVTDAASVDYYQIRINDEPKYQQKYPPETRLKIDDLEPGNTYHICVFVEFKISVTIAESRCIDTTTRSTAPDPDGQTDGERSKEIGIIAGCVVGGVALILIIALIIFFLRRNNNKEKPHTYVNTIEANAWQRAEMPKVLTDSKRFTKAKKPSNPDHKIERIQHIHVDPNTMDRISGGSYQNLHQSFHSEDGNIPQNNTGYDDVAPYETPHHYETPVPPEMPSHDNAKNYQELHIETHI